MMQLMDFLSLIPCYPTMPLLPGWSRLSVKGNLMILKSKSGIPSFGKLSSQEK